MAECQDGGSFTLQAHTGGQGDKSQRDISHKARRRYRPEERIVVVVPHSGEGMEGHILQRAYHDVRIVPAGKGENHHTSSAESTPLPFACIFATSPRGGTHGKPLRVAQSADVCLSSDCHKKCDQMGFLQISRLPMVDD